ncbi:MAG TPA: hypothetical protein VG795_02730 [Acidimicrobiia bacterium]|nr:hypothetical protein [Acidimicrobiia bacterium]
MPLRRALMVSAGGVAVVMLQALVFGNQWFFEWVFENDLLEGSGAADLLRSVLLFPSWRLTPAGGFSSMLVPDFSLLVLFVLLAAFTTLGLMTLDPVRGTTGALVCGWWATFLAAGIMAFVRQLLAALLLDYPDPFFRFAVLGGLEYALFAGWVPGVAVLVAYVLTRPGTAPGWSPEVSGEPAGA